jgi:WD40 repeat protein
VNQRGPLQKTIVLKSEDEYKASRSGAVEDEIDYLRAQSTYGNYTLKTTKIQDPVLKITRDRRVYKTIRRDAASGYAHHCYTFTRDGRYLVSGGGNGFLTLYETETGRKVRDFVGHTGDVWAIAVAPDNQFLVSGKD